MTSSTGRLFSLSCVPGETLWGSLFLVGCGSYDYPGELHATGEVVSHYAAWLSADLREVKRSGSGVAARWHETRPHLREPSVGVSGECICHWDFGEFLIFAQTYSLG